ncbi:methylmalonic aciduria type A protein, mitochondrial-like [Amblyomma americanum]|uniref:Membrane atpase/protein kinase n=1 Tax=Amblyomma americanum TaxID=6943 RepID=A0AAQ4DZ84_AMBAM
MLLSQVTSRAYRFTRRPLRLNQFLTNRGSRVSAATQAIESERIRRLFEGLVASDRASLAQSITLIESTARKDHEEAQDLLQLVLQENKARRKDRQLGSFRMGLTGPPGTGKSTFIETFGKFLTGSGHKVAVLTVDPSSAVTGGSLLGDKTRMTHLTRDPNAYIRPSPTRGHSGGVTRTTCDAIQLCECAGYDVVLVETVGVGQSEYMVADMVDLFLLLIPPGGGDELQGVKRGIVEMADLIAVTKADGDHLPEVRRMAAEYISALKFMKPRSHHWRPKVLQVSAKANVGISELWNVVQEYRQVLEPSGELDNRRRQQRVRWLWTYVGSELERRLRSHPDIAACTAELEKAVIDETVTPGHACDQLMSHFFKGDS